MPVLEPEGEGMRRLEAVDSKAEAGHKRQLVEDEGQSAGWYMWLC